MSSFDGSGALEARIQAARQKSAEQAQRLAAEEAARQAAVAARSDESAALVRDFIKRARALGIKPQFILPAAVEQRTGSTYKGFRRMRNATIERVLDGTMTSCWHLGPAPNGGKSKAEPYGHSYYFLSETGQNLVRKHEPIQYETWSGIQQGRIIRWVPRTPDLSDVVYMENRGGESSDAVTLPDAMVAFFMSCET